MDFARIQLISRRGVGAKRTFKGKQQRDFADRLLWNYH
jgi:hypothetical protein